MSPLHACPGCGRLIPIGTPRCEACMPEARKDAERNAAITRRAYDRERDPVLKSFYRSSAWRRLSASKLDRDRLCEAKLPGCQRIACEVHHIKPVRTPEGWELRFEWTNLMSVCTRCHNALDGKWGKATGRKPDAEIDPSIVDLSRI